MMNTTRKLSAKTCIDGLQELVLDALIEPKKKCKWLGPSKIRDKAGIQDQFEDKEARKWTTPLTRAILCELRREGRVLGEKRGPLKGGKPTLVWQLTNEEYEKRCSS